MFEEQLSDWLCPCRPPAVSLCTLTAERRKKRRRGRGKFTEQRRGGRRRRRWRKVSDELVRDQ